MFAGLGTAGFAHYDCVQVLTYGARMIRAVAQSDTDRLLRIWLDTFRHAHPSLPDAYWAQQEPLVRRWCGDSSGGRVYCARHRDRADGFALVSPVGEVLLIFVSRALQGRGAGSALLSEAARKHPHLWAAVLEENLGARYFFQTHGFEEQERRYQADASQHRLEMGAVSVRATGS